MICAAREAPVFVGTSIVFYLKYKTSMSPLFRVSVCRRRRCHGISQAVRGMATAPGHIATTVRRGRRTTIHLGSSVDCASSSPSMASARNFSRRLHRHVACRPRGLVEEDFHGVYAVWRKHVFARRGARYHRYVHFLCRPLSRRIIGRMSAVSPSAKKSLLPGHHGAEYGHEGAGAHRTN